MGSDDFDQPGLWDEFQWERFLQQQDRTTEKYFELLERFKDHPERDRLIAAEMGWDMATVEDDSAWEDAAEAFCELEEEQLAEPMDDGFDEFARSPIFQDTLALHSWIHAWLDENPALKDNEDACRLASRSMVCGAKVSAALCGGEEDEPGMTIAYLKRALKAANDSLDAASRLVAGGAMTRKDAGIFRKKIFPIRDRIVDLMKEFRAVWKKRSQNNEDF